MSNVKFSAKATKSQTAIVEALKIRLDTHEAASGKECKTLRADIKSFESVSGLAIIDICLKKGLKLDDFIANINVLDKSDDRHIAVKVITKIRQLMKAIAENNARHLDGYTHSIVRNLLVNKSLTVFECERCLSTNIVNDGIDTFKLDETKKIIAYKNTAPSTAETQSSSTRMMLKLLDVCTTVKGQKDATLTFNESAHAELFLNMYAIDSTEPANA